MCAFNSLNNFSPGYPKHKKFNLEFQNNQRKCCWSKFGHKTTRPLTKITTKLPKMKFTKVFLFGQTVYSYVYANMYLVQKCLKKAVMNPDEVLNVLTNKNDKR